MLTALVWGPHFEIPWWRQMGRGRKCKRSFIHPPSHQTGVTHYASGPVPGVEDTEEDQGDCCQRREREMLGRDIRGLWLEAVVSAMKEKNVAIQGIITEWGVSSVLPEWTWHMRRLCRIRRIWQDVCREGSLWRASICKGLGGSSELGLFEEWKNLLMDLE